jgi:hypothetical protein
MIHESFMFRINLVKTGPMVALRHPEMLPGGGALWSPCLVLTYIRAARSTRNHIFWRLYLSVRQHVSLPKNIQLISTKFGIRKSTLKLKLLLCLIHHNAKKACGEVKAQPLDTRRKCVISLTLQLPYVSLALKLPYIGLALRLPYIVLALRQPYIVLALRLPSSESKIKPSKLVSFLAYSSTLKMEAICSTITSVDLQRTTRRHIPEDRKHPCENLKCYILWPCFRLMLRVRIYIFPLGLPTLLGLRGYIPLRY